MKRIVLKGISNSRFWQYRRHIAAQLMSSTHMSSNSCHIYEHVTAICQRLITRKVLAR